MLTLDSSALSFFLDPMSAPVAARPGSRAGHTPPVVHLDHAHAPPVAHALGGSVPPGGLRPHSLPSQPRPQRRSPSGHSHASNISLVTRQWCPQHVVTATPAVESPPCAPTVALQPTPLPPQTVPWRAMPSAAVPWQSCSGRPRLGASLP